MFNTLQKHNTMKRLFTFGLMLVSAFALTNCAEEIAAPVQDDITVDGNIENITPPEEEVNIPFEVFATVGGEADTKTVNWGNATYWKDKDQISVFHGTGENYTHNSIFELIDASTGKFAGALKITLNEKNGWYFLYPYSSSATTLTVSGVQIGAQTINKTLISAIDENIVLSANSKAHICGNLSPMLGRITNLPRNEQPEIEMKHLAAIVAIKVVNDGFGGDIKIKDVEFAVPDVYKTDNNGKIVPDANGKPIKLQDAFPIVGQFQVNMANGQCTAISDNSFASTKFELPSAVSLKKGDALTFYLPVMPFSATKTISIKVNSSERAISKAVKLESGKVTTFTVPVRALTHPVITDATSITSKGRMSSDQPLKVVNPPQDSNRTIKINGQDIEAYFLGSPKDKDGNYQTGSITITGFFKDLITALPINFYVSSYNDEPAVMTVNKVTVAIPAYAEEVEGGKWDKNKTKTVDYSVLEKRTGLTEFASSFELTRGLIIKLGDSVEEKITFTNISHNGYFDNSNVVVLNDDFAHKQINEQNIGNFLTSFTYNGKKATYEGLLQIATIDLDKLPTSVKWTSDNYGVKYSIAGPSWDEATKVNYSDDKDKVETLADNYPELVETISAIFGRLLSVEVANMKVAGLIFPHEIDMLHKLRDAQVTIELTTMQEGPCVVFWGLDAYTADDKKNDQANNKDEE